MDASDNESILDPQQNNGNRQREEPRNGFREGEPRVQQRRMTLQPFDDHLQNHPIFTHPNFEEVSLSVLKSEDAIRHRLNFKYIDVQLIRLITSNQCGASVYSKRRLNIVHQNSMKFTRLILARVVSSLHPDENIQLVYIMEARNQNQNLWSKNVNHRDSGAISIGSIIRVPCPLPIDIYMRCDIPMIRSQFPAILLRSPARLGSVAINESIESNTSLAFVYNGTQVTINLSVPLKTTCAGNLCDRQRIIDWCNSKGCGCYGMNTNSSSLAIQHALEVETINNGTLKMDDFSSKKFSKLYLNGDIPGSVKLYMLQLTQASMDMFISVEECINLINDNGGFTIVGWYKRGVINDRTIVNARAANGNNGGSGGNAIASNNNNDDQQAQVDSGDISYHIVSITPTNQNFFDRLSVLGQQLHQLKYDVSEIESTTVL